MIVMKKQLVKQTKTVFSLNFTAIVFKGRNADTSFNMRLV